MSIRRSVLYVGLTFSLASLAFSLGSWVTQRHMAQQLAANDARLTALRDEMARSMIEARGGVPQVSATRGVGKPDVVAVAGSAKVAAGSAKVAVGSAHQDIVDEVKRQLQSEMGLFPVRLLRDRKESFVELNAYDNFGKTNYGTAGYLGGGYFITVKHGVLALDEPADGHDARRITAIKVRYKGKDLNARIVDSGNANVEVHSGDWAIIKVNQELDIPALHVDTSYAYDFAEPIFRLGNDYSKGIILSTGYVGQRTTNGLVTCLTDGHPGVSGGGVLNQEGSLVGIPVGRMQGDYRFSFILPIRPEMFRKVPAVTHSRQPADETTVVTTVG